MHGIVHGRCKSMPIFARHRRQEGLTGEPIPLVGDPLEYNEAGLEYPEKPEIQILSCFTVYTRPPVCCAVHIHLISHQRNSDRRFCRQTIVRTKFRHLNPRLAGGCIASRNISNTPHPAHVFFSFPFTR